MRDLPARAALEWPLTIGPIDGSTGERLLGRPYRPFDETLADSLRWWANHGTIPRSWIGRLAPDALGCVGSPWPRSGAAAKRRLRDLVASVVAGAHERARLDVLEAQRERLDLHLGELVGVVVALERQVLLATAAGTGRSSGCRTSTVAQGLERLGQLVARLAQADHQARLRVDRVAGARRRIALARAQDAQRAVPAGALADRLLEPLDRLEVVVEDVRPGLHDRPQRVSAPLKSGIRTSTPMPGHSRRSARIVSAKMCAPPSGRSSRATLVTTTCSRPHAARPPRRRGAARRRRTRSAGRS